MFHVIMRSVPVDVTGGGGGGGGGGGAATEPATTLIESRLNPPTSNASVMTCVPAPSVTGTLTVDHVCQPPVLGIVTAVHTWLGPLNPTCSDPPPLGDPTRSCAV